MLKTGAGSVESSDLSGRALSAALLEDQVAST
jgi:hypothetical protein